MPIAFYDTECYPNFWLLKFRPKGGSTLSWSIKSGERLKSWQISQIIGSFVAHTVVSFNGIYYDVPMICAAIEGYTCEQLKWLNDQIIVEKRKPWELGLPDWKPKDHIDIIETLPGAGSQKMYAGRIHCKTMQDLPYDPSQYLTDSEIEIVDKYCGNDLSVLASLFDALAPQIQLREDMGARYGIDLRSKSDAQVAEAVIKHRCEQALGRRLYKADIDWNLAFRYEPPDFLRFRTPQLQRAFDAVKSSVFTLGPSGAIAMPPQLEGLAIPLGGSMYRMGIGGLHSSEKSQVYRSSGSHVLRDSDVRGYYPRLMLNSGKYPPALGPQFLIEFGGIVSERDVAKALEQAFRKQGIDTRNRANVEAYRAASDNEGGKVMSNGTFGKTLSIYSILFAPQMGIQTTITGQLSVLMAIEDHELAGIPVISANTDGFVSYCPRHLVATSDALIKDWEARTGLEMEGAEYSALYSRDVNNYFAVKTDGSVKRKGAYSKAGLIEKKSPDVEICGDAVAEFLSKGTPILQTLVECRDIRKFVTIQKVAGGGVKLWGEGPRKGTLVRNMTPTLEASGWRKNGRKWERKGVVTDANSAYVACFAPQTPQYLGKVIRWFYANDAPGPIIYNRNGNLVGDSYGANPCMTLPDIFPSNVDYAFYYEVCLTILKDIGYKQ